MANTKTPTTSSQPKQGSVTIPETSLTDVLTDLYSTMKGKMGPNSMENKPAKISRRWPTNLDSLISRRKRLLQIAPLPNQPNSNRSMDLVDDSDWVDETESNVSSFSSSSVTQTLTTASQQRQPSVQAEPVTKEHLFRKHSNLTETRRSARIAAQQCRVSPEHNALNYSETLQDTVSASRTGRKRKAGEFVEQNVKSKDDQLQHPTPSLGTESKRRRRATRSGPSKNNSDRTPDAAVCELPAFKVPPNLAEKRRRLDVFLMLIDYGFDVGVNCQAWTQAARNARLITDEAWDLAYAQRDILCGTEDQWFDSHLTQEASGQVSDDILGQDSNTENVVILADKCEGPRPRDSIAVKKIRRPTIVEMLRFLHREELLEKNRALNVSLD